MLAVTVGLSKFWSSFELLSASKTSVISNRGLVELLLLSWPLGTPDRDLARCLSLATALGRERRMLNPGLPAVCTESDPLPEENDWWSPWPAPPSSPLAVLAFAPILHATNVHANTAARRRGRTRTVELWVFSLCRERRTISKRPPKDDVPSSGRRRPEHSTSIAAPKINCQRVLLMAHFKSQWNSLGIAHRNKTRFSSDFPTTVWERKQRKLIIMTIW